MRSAIIAANQLGIEFTMACNTEMADKEGYAQDCKVYGIALKHVSFNRNPISAQNYLALKQLNQIMREGNYDIVHCNTPIGGIIGRICAHKNKIKKTIYMAHGFHFYQGAPIKNWLLYYPVEKFFSRLTDILVTITLEDYDLSKKMHAKKCRYIHGVGIDVTQFKRRLPHDRNSNLRKMHGIPEDAYVILSVGELNRNKNHRVVIEAINHIPNKNIFYVICGEGELRKEYEDLLQRLKMDNRVLLVGFRTNVSEYYRMADLLVFPSLREGIPASIMEAIATGVPVLASNIRGIKDIIKQEQYRFNPQKVEDIAKKIMQVISTNNDDCIEDNIETIKPYEFTNVVEEFTRLYKETM